MWGCDLIPKLLLLCQKKYRQNGGRSKPRLFTYVTIGPGEVLVCLVAGNKNWRRAVWWKRKTVLQKPQNE
jgi:hypothetical protein